MPRQATVYKILIASPSDLKTERKAIPEVIHEWNDLHADKYGAMLQAIMWEKHAAPEMGDRPQAIVNRQIVDKCNILIGAFWTRLGTPTGVADSGTIEEIEKFLKANKPVLLYFSSRKIQPEDIDSEQYKLLKKHREEYKKQGIVWKYKTIPELRRQLEKHITSTIEQLQASSKRKKPDLEIKEEKEKPSRKEHQGLMGLSDSELMERLKEAFTCSLKKLREEWNIEKASEPLNTEKGASLLIDLREELTEFSRALGGTAGNEFVVETKRIVNLITKIDNYSGSVEYTDSRFKGFWKGGEEVFERIEGIMRYLESPEDNPLDIRTTPDSDWEDTDPFAQ